MSFIVIVSELGTKLILLIVLFANPIAIGIVPQFYKRLYKVCDKNKENKKKKAIPMNVLARRGRKKNVSRT